MEKLLLSIIIVLAGIYFVGLALVSLFTPERAKSFLHSFAGTAPKHFIELVLRLVIGTAFILCAPQMFFSGIFTAFGWVLVVTTVIMFFVPWKLHRRFAEWSVPQATKHMMLLGVGSFIAGFFILFSFFFGPGAA